MPFTLPKKDPFVLKMFKFLNFPVPLLFSLSAIAEFIGKGNDEWREIALARAHTRQYLFRRAVVARAKLNMTS